MDNRKLGRQKSRSKREWIEGRESPERGKAEKENKIRKIPTPYGKWQDKRKYKL